MLTNPKEVARRIYQACADSDRPAIETVIADDFHFTNSLDNWIDRATYFKRCWPNHETIVEYAFVDLVDEGD